MPRGNAGCDVEQPLAPPLHDELPAGEGSTLALIEKELLYLFH
ncbi:MAG: hypothetical protein ABI335_31550 [Polyangiaceae bacterium]